jgi:hypothetical protein
MAPEIFEWEEDGTKRPDRMISGAAADMWAAGVFLFFMLAGVY